MADFRCEKVCGNEWVFREPKEWEFWITKFYRAEEDREEKRYEAAREKYLSILEDCPKHIGTLNGLGLIALKEGDLDWAVASFEEAIAIGKKHIPPEFDGEHDCLPWHFIDNRHFLRAHLFLAYAQLILTMDLYQDFVTLSGRTNTVEDLMRVDVETVLKFE